MKSVSKSTTPKVSSVKLSTAKVLADKSAPSATADPDPEALSLTTDEEVLQHVFAANGLLARAFRTKDKTGHERVWEQRPEQREMAEAVAAAIKNEEHLLVEAGTGVGKSYAYLVPFILWAMSQHKRVLIATHTKALQQQLVERDLPFLHDLFLRRLGLEFRFSLCLGTQNYICPRRLAKAEAGGLFATRDDVLQLKDINAFARRSKTGRSLDLPFEPSAQLWSQVNRESDLCLGRACPQYDSSFYYIARREQERAHILVANHHLLFAHLAAGGNEAGAVLPPFDAVIIDEAHQAEEVASTYLGMEVSNLAVARLIELIHHRRNNHTILSASKLPQREELEKKLIEAAEEAREATGRFFENMQVVLNLDASRPQSLRLREAHWMENTLNEPLGRLEGVLRDARKSAEKLADEALLRELEGYTTRCFDMRTELNAVLAHTEKNYVYWAEVQPRMADTNAGGRVSTRVPRLALCGAPIDVAEAMQQTLFGKVCPVVLTSATLTTGAPTGANAFEFLRERLGLTPEKSEKGVRTLSLGSPFDYRKNAMLYVTKDLPDPAQAAVFESAASKRAAEVLKATHGRAFVLCTSFRMVDGTARVLRESLPKDIRVLKQGEMSRGKLLDEFRKDISSVLVGTTSFWQGVDVPGESLTCVVIMKLPFAVPDDPLVQARVEALRQQGRDAFHEYQVPQAVMMFRQGFGRLIRTASDRGIVAVLDPRVLTKRYGAMFLDALPECAVTDDLDFIAEFARGDGTGEEPEAPITAHQSKGEASQRD